ncbi:ABC transporter ATP-binding protein [Arthrobacter sp. UM1]|uniref:ABC transporter ATP-binding protein n=1 Tax=Arthrobacter sp. UM1 TaxID=2766776 RepID=UPI001CF61F09|nr:ABC transporter ATP-binding protein [Arthrobacter sp. UM1]MCB4209070.1 ABC transporter ATP-binding protein [Arthrobacter sp. UM1]
MLTADQVSFRGHHAPILTPTSLQAAPGEVTVVVGSTQEARTALALILTDRLRPSAGTVKVEGSPRLRARSSLVDAPEISEPGPEMRVIDLATEEFALSPTSPPWGLRRRARAWLEENGFADIAGDYLEQLAGPDLVSLQARLALVNGNVDVVVVDAPDRRAGEGAWLEPLEELAAEHPGLVVVAVVTEAPEGFAGRVCEIGTGRPAEADDGGTADADAEHRDDERRDTEDRDTEAKETEDNA